MSDRTGRPGSGPGTAAEEMGSAGSAMAREAASGAARAGQAMADAQGRMASTALGEFQRLFSQMPMVPDMQMLMNAHRRNMETLSAANRVALEGAQMVARRHMEIMQQSMAELTDSMRQIASPDAPQQRAARQAELLKASYERAVNNMRELSDLIQRANGEAVGLLNQRFSEAMDEVRTLLEQSRQSSKG